MPPNSSAHASLAEFRLSASPLGAGSSWEPWRAAVGRARVKTLSCHFSHVNFGQVCEIALDFSNLSSLLRLLRGRHFRFSHGLGRELPERVTRFAGVATTSPVTRTTLDSKPPRWQP